MDRDGCLAIVRKYRNGLLCEDNNDNTTTTDNNHSTNNSNININNSYPERSVHLAATYLLGQLREGVEPFRQQGEYLVHHIWKQRRGERQAHGHYFGGGA